MRKRPKYVAFKHILIKSNNMKRLFLLIMMLIITETSEAVELTTRESLKVPTSNIEKNQEEGCQPLPAQTFIECMTKQLDRKNLDLEKLISEILDTESSWGEDATKEIHARLIDAQKSWKKYRDKQCSYDYYSNLKMHSSSSGIPRIACKKKKTEERIKELKETYLGGF